MTESKKTEPTNKDALDDETLRIELHDGSLHRVQARLTTSVGAVELDAVGDPDTINQGIEQLYSCINILEEFDEEETTKNGDVNESEIDEALPNVRYGDETTTTEPGNG